MAVLTICIVNLIIAIITIITVIALITLIAIVITMCHAGRTSRRARLGAGELVPPWPRWRTFLGASRWPCLLHYANS